MHILLTNDDGVRAPGLAVLKHCFAAHGYEVTVVAPNGQRSAASHAMTIRKPLYCQETTAGDGGIREIAVSGTPVDCVKLAMEYFLCTRRPDVIVSGINDGFNLGSDVLYSGTVSAAMEGPYYQVPALAVSMGKMDRQRGKETAEIVHGIIQNIVVRDKFPGILNVNIPLQGPVVWENIRVVPQALQVYNNVILEKRDMDNGICYHIEGSPDLEMAPEESDIACVRRGKIAVTPLQWQQTAKNAILTVQQGLQKNTCHL